MKKIIQALLLSLLSISAASSFAEEIKITAIVPKPISVIPETGQTTKYVNFDDGDYQIGAPISGAHYQDNGDGTITDRATGLMWVKSPNLIIPGSSVTPDNQIHAARGKYTKDVSYKVAELVEGVDANNVGTGHFYVCVSDTTEDPAVSPNAWQETVWTDSADNLDTPKKMKWDDAITNCNALNYAGHTGDWRLPNAKELQSIVNYGNSGPAIGESTLESPWAKTQNDHYWSSTTYATITSSAFFVEFSDGTSIDNDKNGMLYVRPVRGGR